MSSETRALVELTLANETFNTKYDVECFIDDKKDMIKYLRQKLFALAMMTEPKKFIEEDDDPMLYIQREFDQCWEDLNEYQYKLFVAEAMLDAWDDMTEKGIPKYDPLMYGRLGKFQRIEGDFVQMSYKGEKVERESEVYVGDNIYTCAKSEIEKISDKVYSEAYELEEIKIQAREPEFYNFCKEHGLDPLKRSSKKEYWNSQDKSVL